MWKPFQDGVTISHFAITKIFNTSYISVDSGAYLNAHSILELVKVKLLSQVKVLEQVKALFQVKILSQSVNTS